LKESSVTRNGGKASHRRVLRSVAEVYDWLDRQIRKDSVPAGTCEACGACCDFEAFDHRLFVTPPELAYLAAHLGTEDLKPMPTGRCPYNVAGKCSVYQHRFAGCRIFCCKGDANFQGRLSELALKRFKAICEGFQISYRYIDLPTALNNPDHKKRKSERQLSTAFRKSRYYARMRLLRRFAPRNDEGQDPASLRARQSPARQSRSRTINEMRH
jgi:Fe-S-cluster containining protein